MLIVVALVVYDIDHGHKSHIVVYTYGIPSEIQIYFCKLARLLFAQGVWLVCALKLFEVEVSTY